MVSMAPVGLLALILTAGTLGLPLSLPPLPVDATIERAMPDECLLLAWSAGIAKADPKSANQTEQLLAEKEVQEFASQVGEQIVNGLNQVAGRNPEMEPLAKLGPPIAKLLLSRPMAFFVDRFEVRPGGPPNVRATLIVNCGTQTADAKQWLADLEELAAKNRAPVDRIKDIKLGGVALRQLAVPGVTELSWGFKDDYFLLTLGEGAAEELIERISTSGKPAAWLANLRRQVGIKRLATLGYLNVARVLEIAVPLIPDPQAAAVVDALGLTNVQVVASASGLDGQGIVSRTLANIDGTPQGLFELVSDKRLTPDALKHIPQDTTFAAAFRLDLATVYKHVLERVGNVEPRAAEQLQRNLTGVEQTLGFQVEQGLLASLGDLWTVFTSADGGANPWTGLMVTVSVRDQAKLVDIEERLLKLVEPGAGPGGPPFSIRETKLHGVVVHQLLPKGPVPVAPAWCILDDRLVVAATLQTLKAHLSREEKSSNLADVPEVAARFKQAPALSALSYQDSKAALQGMYAMVQMYGPVASGALAQQGIEIDLPPLPSLKLVEPHVLPLVSSAQRTKSGLLWERYQSVPVMGTSDSATTGVLIGLLLPAVQAAREAARRNQTANNLKQLALSMHIYHDVNKRFPAAAIADKEGKHLLSWRVALLPYMDEKPLYDQFHLDEPWDSEHNRKLIDKMPQVFANPNLDNLGGKTVYLVPTGEKTMFAGKKGINIKGITDGTSNTIMIVEADADHAVEWTRPDDLQVDAKKPLEGLLGVRPGVFMAAFADGSVRAISDQVDRQTLSGLFTAAGGEVVRVPDN